ncbi:hypothetical protein Tco_1057214 [Tanacetum coccineum]|uniref:Retrotransposon gag domain-containing protein n=1 Tax=Tanacetum coccineum TaxID=301880 RepID=A0ABQ5H6J1_9ASTR
MEHELWNLRVKEYDIVAYTQRFNELALMCPRMVEPERVKVDAYIRGLTDKPSNGLFYRLVGTIRSNSHNVERLDIRQGHTRNRCPKKVKQEEVGVCVVELMLYYMEAGAERDYPTEAAVEFRIYLRTEAGSLLLRCSSMILSVYSEDERAWKGKHLDFFRDAEEREISEGKGIALRVRALMMTVHNDLPKQIREAQEEAMKRKNVKAKNI